ncbi:hypothetical protein SLEP1_g55710 [Rubroshorea leprosula]|nr:hypothetical protein SLEP1_g55710 [Rubroshorea leprosula]
MHGDQVDIKKLVSHMSSLACLHSHLLIHLTFPIIIVIASLLPCNVQLSS